MSSWINTLESDDTENHVSTCAQSTSTVISDGQNAYILDRQTFPVGSAPPPPNPFANGKMGHGDICSPLPNRIWRGGQELDPEHHFK